MALKAPDRSELNSKDAVEAFSDAVNTFSVNAGDIRDAAAAFCSQHRTLQQSMVRFIDCTIKEVAKLVEGREACFSDGRNEQAIKWIKEAAKIDVPLPMI